MATTTDFLQYILQCLPFKGLTYRKMMGEYLLYKEGVLFGGIYDNRLLIKPLPSLSEFLKDCDRVFPYKGSKTLMYFIENTDDKEFTEKLYDLI